MSAAESYVAEPSATANETAGWGVVWRPAVAEIVALSQPDVSGLVAELERQAAADFAPSHAQLLRAATRAIRCGCRTTAIAIIEMVIEEIGQ